ncbi:MAG: LysR family transcriptional regulator [Bauldia sp.]
MELRQLGFFLGVAESGSFSKAAVRLSVAQPILSRQIKLLEEELGVELFYRNGRGVVLSEAGKTLESYARNIVDLVDRARSEMGMSRNTPQGRVAIAMPPSIGWVLTGPLVLRSREAFPSIVLHIVEGFSGHVAEWLSTGSIDIGIVYQAPRRPTLATEPLFSDDLILLGAVDDPREARRHCRRYGQDRRVADDPSRAPARPARAGRCRAGEAGPRRARRVRGGRDAVHPQPGRARRRLHRALRGRGHPSSERRPHPPLVAH